MGFLRGGGDELFNRYISGDVKTADISTAKDILRFKQDSSKERIDHLLEVVIIAFSLFGGVAVALLAKNDAVRTGGFGMASGALGAVIQKNGSKEAAKIAAKEVLDERDKSLSFYPFSMSMAGTVAMPPESPGNDTPSEGSGR